MADQVADTRIVSKPRIHFVAPGDVITGDLGYMRYTILHIHHHSQLLMVILAIIIEVMVHISMTVILSHL